MVFFAILFGVVALICAVVYAAILLTYWLVIIFFFVLAAVLGLVTGDMTLGFFVAIPVTAIVFWAFGWRADRGSKD